MFPLVNTKHIRTSGRAQEVLASGTHASELPTHYPGPADSVHTMADRVLSLACFLYDIFGRFLGSRCSWRLSSL